jgi:hypothetical protein
MEEVTILVRANVCDVVAAGSCERLPQRSGPGTDRYSEFV